MTSFRSQSPHVFVYGSLMWPDVRSRVLRTDPEAQAATVRGYRRQALKGRPYPALVPAGEGIRITGQILRDVPPDDLRRLDAFEGRNYRRVTVPVALHPHGDLLAGLYLWQAGADALAPDEWDPDWFAREGLPQFLAAYEGFPPRPAMPIRRKLREKMSAK